VKLTQNEKRVLAILVQDGRISNKDVADRCSLSVAGVGKIRKRLEDTGMVQGYSTQVSFSKLGINVWAKVLARVTQEGWNFERGRGVLRYFIRSPNLVDVVRLPEGGVTHLFTFAFRNIEEMDRYFHVLQSRYGRYLEVVKIYSISNSSIEKNSATDLIVKLIDEWDEPRLAEPAELPLER